MKTLENGALRLTIRPDLGGRIDHLADKRTGKDWLWHPPGYCGAARELPLGASYDDHWSGGFDEIFPSDAACLSQGRELPVHGELWSQAWELVDFDARGARLAYSCQSVPIDVEKTIELDAKRPEVRISYLLKSRADEEVDYSFKLHPALAIEPGDAIVMPSCQVKPVNLGFSRLLKDDGWRPWSQAGLGTVPERGEAQEFVYAKDLGEGSVALHNERTGTSLRMGFARESFPYVWLFQLYGGWQGIYALVMEPATNFPWDLDEARRAGTCARIGPRERQRFEIEMSILGS